MKMWQLAAIAVVLWAALLLFIIWANQPDQIAERSKSCAERHRQEVQSCKARCLNSGAESWKYQGGRWDADCVCGGGK
jgi:hypothetical protein